MNVKTSISNTNQIKWSVFPYHIHFGCDLPSATIAASDRIIVAGEADLDGNKSCLLFKSDDNGLTWQNIHTCLKSSSFRSIHFTDQIHGYIVGHIEILTTEDGGNNWSSAQPNDNNLVDIQFINSKEAIGIGVNSELLKFSDDLKNVKESVVTLPFSRAAKNNVVLFVTYGSPGGSISNRGLAFDSRPHLSSLCIPTSASGFVVGESGTILRTSDSGNTWFSQDSGVVEDLKSVDFWGENLGLAVGDYGTIIRTEDSGEHWTIIRSTAKEISRTSGLQVDKKTRYVSIKKNFTVENFYCVKFQNEKLAWAVGNIGINPSILLSRDGGISWNTELTVTTLYSFGRFNTILLIPHHIFAFGSDGLVAIGEY